MTRYRRRIRSWALMAAAALSGGTTFVSCQSRFLQTVNDGMRTWALSLLDPSIYLDALLDETQDE